MSDKELLEATAKLMECTYHSFIGWYWVGFSRQAVPWNPLRNDEHAMALVKRFPSETTAALRKRVETAANGPELVERALAFNRTIVEAVATCLKKGE